MGLAGRLLPVAHAVRLRRGARAVGSHLRGDLLPRAVAIDRARRGARTHDFVRGRRGRRRPLQFDLWGVEPSDRHDWATLRERIVEHGLRNSLWSLPSHRPPRSPRSPVATSASSHRSSNLFKRETLSGEFLQINSYLVRDLQELGCGPRRSGTRSSRPTDRSRTSKRSRTRSVSCTARRGTHRSAEGEGAAAAAGAHRHGGCTRPASSTRASRSTSSSSPRRSGKLSVDVPLRVEEGAQDDVLPALPSGDSHHENDRRGAEHHPRLVERSARVGAPLVCSPHLGSSRATPAVLPDELLIALAAAGAGTALVAWSPSWRRARHLVTLLHESRAHVRRDPSWAEGRRGAPAP